MENSTLKARTAPSEAKDLESEQGKFIRLRPAFFQLILAVEFTQTDQFRKVFEWMGKQQKPMDAPLSMRDFLPVVPDALRIHVKPKDGGEIIQPETGEAAGLIVTEFTTEISVRLFTHEKRLFALVEGDFLELEGDEEAFEMVRARDEQQNRSLPEGFLNWNTKYQQVTDLLAPVQRDILARASNFHADSELNRAIMLKDREGIWRTNKNTGAKYCETTAGTIIYQPQEVADMWFEAQYNAALDALETKLSSIKSDLTADVIDILFHRWNTYPYPKKRDKAHITMAQICEYRDVLPTGDNIKNIWQAIRVARSIRLQEKGIDAALFDMDAAQAPQLNLFGLDAPAEADTVFIYSPGFFLAEAIENNGVFLAPYLQKIWELNPKFHSVTKRLARYLRGEWRRNTQAYLNLDGTPVEPPNRFSTWAQIFDGAGVDVDEWCRNNPKNPTRFITTAEAALEELMKMDFTAEVTYERPDLLKGLPRKGLLAAWLSLDVHIAPSAQIRDALRETNTQRIKHYAIQAEQRAKALPGAPRTRRKKGG